MGEVIVETVAVLVDGIKGLIVAVGSVLATSSRSARVRGARRNDSRVCAIARGQVPVTRQRRLIVLENGQRRPFQPTLHHPVHLQERLFLKELRARKVRHLRGKGVQEVEASIFCVVFVEHDAARHPTARQPWFGLVEGGARLALRDAVFEKHLDGQLVPAGVGLRTLTHFGGVDVVAAAEERAAVAAVAQAARKEGGHERLVGHGVEGAGGRGVGGRAQRLREVICLMSQAEKGLVPTRLRTDRHPTSLFYFI